MNKSLNIKLSFREKKIKKYIMELYFKLVWKNVPKSNVKNEGDRGYKFINLEFIQLLINK